MAAITSDMKASSNSGVRRSRSSGLRSRRSPPALADRSFGRSTPPLVGRPPDFFGRPPDLGPDLLLDAGLPAVDDLPPDLGLPPDAGLPTVDDLPPDAGLPLALGLLPDLGLPARPDADMPPGEVLLPPVAGLPRPVPLLGLGERLDDALRPDGRAPELLRPDPEPRPAPVRPDRPSRAPPSATSFSSSARRRVLRATCATATGSPCNPSPPAAGSNPGKH